MAVDQSFEIFPAVVRIQAVMENIASQKVLEKVGLKRRVCLKSMVFAKESLEICFCIVLLSMISNIIIKGK
ncbi:BnaA01g24610D [Brassica napus]|uniref:BnaA01g24610D protein n=1 Tax=Brassica napus TaxID=3708 RepID=A0A078H9S1_BRANA|nr:BnaA01g24610D [Brassica napus]